MDFDKENYQNQFQNKIFFNNGFKMISNKL